MAHSSIQIKNCKFSGCMYWPEFGADGYCWRHESAESKSKKTRKIYLAQKEKNKKIDPALLLSDYNYPTVADWVSYHVRNSARVCDNCDADLSTYTYGEWCGSQHHVLEKVDFPSVKTNLFNHLVMGMYCCHTQWHTSQMNASKMRVFSHAEDIVIKLYPLLTYNELKKISVYYTFERV